MGPRQIARQKGDKMFIQFCKYCNKDNEHYVSGGCICKRGSRYGKKQHSKSRLKQEYNGMTPEDWLRLYEKQGGKCLTPSCNFTHHARWWEQGQGGFHVHHDHNDDEIIGLLCHECNQAEGHINKDPIRTQELIDMKYLHKNKDTLEGMIRGTVEGHIKGIENKDGTVTWNEPTITKNTHRLITL